MAKRVDAARVGGDHAADRRAATRGEVDSERQAGLGGGALKPFERDAGTGRHRAGDRVDVADRRQPRRRQHDCFMGNGAADQTGITALRHDRHSGRGAHADGLSDLGRGLRPNQRERPPTETARPVDLVRCEDAGVGDHGVLAQRGTQRAPDVVAHPRSVRRRPGRMTGASWLSWSVRA